MKTQILAVLIASSCGISYGQETVPSNGQSTPPAYALPTPPVNGRTSPLPPLPRGARPTSDGSVVSPDGASVFRGPLPTDGNPATPEQWRMLLVLRLMSLPSPVHNGAAQLYGMGDEAAVDILRILGTRQPLASAEQQSVLDIVSMSFDHPDSIIDPNYRAPNASVFLLRYIGALSDDASVKNRSALVLARVQSVKPAASPASQGK